MKTKLFLALALLLIGSSSVLAFQPKNGGGLPSASTESPSTSALKALTITGTVLSASNHQPLEFVTVTVFKDGNAFVGGATTDSLGHYKVDGLSKGNYTVKFSYVGLSDVNRNITLSSTSQLPDVILDDNGGTSLDNVTVVGKRPTFTQHLDKKIYNVGSDVTARTGSISDLLQNVPTVDVDIDGNVSLRGNSNVMILVDGRPSAQMNSKNRGDILQQLSASQIERIEVITNPSAEYKPDGVSGVINIITKKNVPAGLNGTVSASAGSKGRYNGGMNLSYQSGKWSLQGGVSYRKDRYDRTTDDKRRYSDHNINQQTYGIGHPTSVQTQLGVGYRISPSDRIEIGGSYARRHFLRDETVNSADFVPQGDTLSTYYRTRNADARETMWNGNAHYEHTYGESNRIDIDYAYSTQKEVEGNDYLTHTTDSTGSADKHENQDVKDAVYMHTASARLEHHFGENITLKAGYEFEAERRLQRFHLFDVTGATRTRDDARSSDFVNNRYINSLYATLQVNVGQWSLLGGLRGEYVWQRSQFITSDSTGTDHYWNLYPTLHATYRINKQQSLLLSYSLRVNRPDGDWLNPYAESINPLSLRSGNPDLEPEKIHSFEIGWQWESPSGTNLLATLYEHHTTNEIVWISRNIGNDAILTRPENAKTHDEAGLELVWSQPVGRWLNFNWNLNGFYSQISSTKQGAGNKHDSWSWSSLLNANFIPMKNLTLQLNMRYRSGRAISQGRRNADTRVNVGMKYEIPKWNLAFVASVTDLFDTYKKSQRISTSDMVRYEKTRRNPRIVYVGAVWNFGYNKKQKQSEIKYDEGM